MKMKTIKLIYSRIIPFPGFYAMNLFGFVIRNVKYRGTNLPYRTETHEFIHTLQAEDFLPNKQDKTWRQIIGYLIFYIVYILEWLIKLILSIATFGVVKAYQSISFERAAYANEGSSEYIANRKRWDWIKYIFTVVT